MNHRRVSVSYITPSTMPTVREGTRCFAAGFEPLAARVGLYFTSDKNILDDLLGAQS